MGLSYIPAWTGKTRIIKNGQGRIYRNISMPSNSHFESLAVSRDPCPSSVSLSGNSIGGKISLLWSNSMSGQFKAEME